LMNDGRSYHSVIRDAETVSCAPYQMKVVIHPSVKIKEFPAGTSLLIKAIRNNASDDGVIFSSGKEILIFHKNWKKGGVATLKISPDTEKFIKILAYADSLGHAYDLLNEETGTELDVLRSVVTRFVESGLCVFQSVGRSYV